MMDVGQDMQPAGGQYGDAPVVYDNVLFTLAHRRLSLKQPADLRQLEVVARFERHIAPVRQHQAGRADIDQADHADRADRR